MPKNLKRMRLYSNLTAPATLYESFDLNNLHLDKCDPTFKAYAEYLVDNRIISPDDKHYVWNNFMNESNTATPVDYLREERNFILPVSLINLQREMVKLGGGIKDNNFVYGAISRSPLQLIIEFNNTPPTDIVLLITYSTIQMAHFSGTITDQSVQFLPKVLIN